MDKILDKLNLNEALQLLNNPIILFATVFIILMTLLYRYKSKQLETEQHKQAQTNTINTNITGSFNGNTLNSQNKNNKY